ncbi:MAG TPA: HAMP domain-containing histidine kinase [Desulfotomaculum sp.]|nr:HAMP domain-containing histidine kinase [Desulfotomaculum sp.]
MRSITWRLTLWYAAILVAILFICGVAAFWVMRHLLLTEAAREVEAAVATVQRLTDPARENGEFNHVDLDDPELTAQDESGIIWLQITAPDGRVLNSSRALGNTVLAPGYTGPPVVTRLRGQKVLLAGAELAGGALVQVARPLSREEIFLGTLAGVLGLLALGGVVLAMAGGWVITRAALRPVQSLIRTARQISTTDLNRRIALRGPRDELYTLAQTFNQMLDRLEQGFRSQQEFVAAASHDLRTPLTILKSYTGLLNRWGKNDPAVVEESIQAMVKAVGVMERLVNDMLLLARMQAGPPLKTTPLPLDELAEETVQEAGVIVKDVAVKLGPVERAVAAADEHYLRRALWALVDNAIKYNRPGGEVVVGVSVAGNKREAGIFVADNGPGIDERELPRIFDRFYRGDPSRSQGKGFGLGLSLAREIVEAHGGRILVESHPGRGSRFTIMLPLWQQEAMTAQ